MRGKRLPFSYKGGTAVFIAYVPGSKGKARKKETHRGISLDEARLRYAKFILRVKGSPETRGAITFGELIDEHWTDLSETWGPTQVKNNWYLVGRRLLPAFGNVRLSAIRDAEIQAFIAAQRRDGLAPVSINNLVRLLRSLLKKAVTFRLVPDVPFRPPKPLRERLLRQELTRDEMGAFLAAFDDRAGFMAQLEGNGASSVMTTKGGETYTRRTTGLAPWSPAAEEAFERFQRTKLFFVLALDLGARKSDLLALTFESVSEDDGWFHFVQAKTGEEVFVPMTDAVRAAVKALRRHASGKRLFSWLPEMTLRRHFAVAKTIAGISRPFRIHDCRHTFGSRLASAGTPLQLIAKALGHTDTRMAERRYARPSKESLRAVRDGLERQGPTEGSGPGGAVQLRIPSGSSEPTR